MEQRKKVVLKREKRSSGNKERQFRPTFPEHFRLLKLSERRRRRWHRHRPLRSFSRPAHIVKASSCASPMRDLKRREEGTRLAIPLRRWRSSPEPNLRASPLSPSIVWFGWPLEIKRSSSLLTPPSSPSSPSLARPVFISLGICSQNRNSTFVQGQVSP